MSSPDAAPSARSGVRLGAGLVALAVAGLALSGCIRPLYGPAASGGTVQQALAGIVIDPVQDRIGHVLVEELRFDTTGGNSGTPPRYRLKLDVNERVGSAIVSSDTGRAKSATLTITVNYTLLDYSSSAEVLKGLAVNSASYDRTEQRFASLRAARDAEDRIAEMLADQIRTRIAADLAFRK